MSYEVKKARELLNFRDVVAAFPDGIVDNDHWLFTGLGGWHGTRMTLDDAELILRDAHPTYKKGAAYITVLVLCPTEVDVLWGEVHVKSLSEVEWMRKQENATLAIIQIAMEGNL